MRYVTVPAPEGSLESVFDAVFRVRPHQDALRERGVLAIAPDGAGQAVRGPPGFWLTVRALALGEDAQVTPRRAGAHVLIAVASGAVAVAPGPRTSGVVLEPRDVALYGPDANVALVSVGDEAARIVVIEYDPPRAPTSRARRRVRPGVARVSKMQPLRRRWPLRLLPADVYGLLSPRDLYPAVGPIARGPGRFEVVGPSQLVVVVATTPPNTGPALHVHRETYEMFVVLDGHFCVTWGDRGERGVVLEPFDAVVLPAGISRAFTAEGPEPGWILPVVVGADDETRDIVWLADVEEKLRAAITPGWLVSLAGRAGIKFGRRPG